MDFCGLPATGGPCKRSPGHGGLCNSGIIRFPSPGDWEGLQSLNLSDDKEPGVVRAVTEIFSDIAADYFMNSSLRRIKRHTVSLLVAIVLFVWLQFIFDLYILFR